ncbi:MAG: undecaprenyl-diphosphate phosphatase [bacterium]
MTIFQALVLGIVEGVTEFLPISSTGHMILVSHWLGLANTDFLKSFEIIIQLGAILSVVVYFWRRIFTDLEIWKKVITAFIPTGIIGFVLYKIIKQYLLGNTMVVLWALLIGGILIIVFEKRAAKLPVGRTELSYKQSAWVGLIQSLAVIPGVSRSAATIVGGMALGVSRQTIVEFSFLLAVPTMLAATGLDLVKNYQLFSIDQLGVLSVGFISAFLVALASVKFLMTFVQKNSLAIFGWYRIVLAAVLLIVFYL